MIKKINLLNAIVIFIVGCMTITACSVEHRIVGKWEVTHNIYQQKYTADKVQQELSLDSIYHDTTFVNHQKGFVYEFKEDRTGVIIPTSSMKAQATPFNYYLKDDDELTIVTGDAEEWDIEKLNGSLMILEIEKKEHHNTVHGTQLPYTENSYQRMELKKR